MTTMNDFGRSPRRLFGRRKGRPLHRRKQALVQDLLPKVRITMPGGSCVAPHAFFEGGRAQDFIAIEIGFGGGEHLAAQAFRRPEARFIGCEPFLNGIASLLEHIDDKKIENVRIHDDDARILLDALADASVDECFVLFPDPWPKKRHIERRFIGPENLERLARVLKPGGLLRVASDHAQLVAWMRECLDASPAFVCGYASGEPPPDWVPTRYQEKAVAAGRPPFFMDYRRKK